MSDYKFAKLIAELESLIRLPAKVNESELYSLFLDAAINELFKKITKMIVSNSFETDHMYRFQLIVHAQEVNDA